MRILIWLVRLAIFLVLFGFALNNQHEVSLRGLFGVEWRTSMVFVVLFAFAAGVAAGVLSMVPSWWRQRRAAQRGVTTPLVLDDAAPMPPDMVAPRAQPDGR
jgi:lipopolysaccharide assembly protein A